MGTPHKHRDLIVQWASGAEVQVKSPEGKWFDAPRPSWYTDFEYRIKPQTVKYRVALIRNRDCDDFSAVAADDEVSAKHVESWGNFSRWLTDWVEVEV